MHEQIAQSEVLRLEGVCRYFYQGQRELRVLDGASATIMSGEAVALIGPSGAGKSTLLHIAGLLETPSAGSVNINGSNCVGLSDWERTHIRRTQIGFVYQFHQLLPEFSALENVMMPQLIAGTPKQLAKNRARALLTTMGLGDRLKHRPAELSGGEQQRTAVCRALANAPRLLLADEPTGNLDPKTSDRVFASILDLIRHTGVSALIATHDRELASRMDRILRLADGILVEVTYDQIR